MQAVQARFTRALNHGSNIIACDNSGAKIIRIISIIGKKTVKGRKPSASVGDLVWASVKKGTPEMRKQVVYAIIVRQKKEFRRYTGERVKFQDNAAVIVKDDKGNPKGTMIKGPAAKEACQRWPPIAKIASMIL